ncbi:MAG: methylated-DNA--[protein]-cysteine S-methyltransferase [Chloroflexi bacterium]|nr:methylated-DNA--[protein]-cysteine S-methyltransferase [Chloroflexota bacterium]
MAKNRIEEELTYDVFDTDMGWVAIVATDLGIVRASLPADSPELALDHVQPEIVLAVHDPEAHDDSRALIMAYCAGEPIDLADIPIDTRSSTPFFRAAWEACRSIPAGETRSYGWLAEQAGNLKAARGAGQAMARNKLAMLVPCHRVISSSGALGGFGGAGLPLKSKLLAMEAGRQSTSDR